MTRKLLLLTGAPESHRLDWAPSSLITTFQSSIAQFALLQPAGPPSVAAAPQDVSHLDLAVWRSLSLQRTHIRTGFSQQHDLRFIGAFPSSADFLTTASISFETASQGRSQQDADDESSRLIAEFYEHSLAVHNDVASSQLVPQPDSQKATSFNTDVSYVSETTTSAQDGEEGDSTTIADGSTLLKAPLRPGRGTDHLSDLEDIPPASYLVSILPATMTVTLIVGIISIAAPRTIKTHYGATKTLVEVLVGDETKSGFSVTFWLADETDEGLLAGLRSQDVVLMQNVALNVFRKRVYGGSLRRGMTRVGLLYRGRRIGSDDEGGYYDIKDLGRVGRESSRILNSTRQEG
ncbi:hypothetical protein N0V93_002498 [Gnomoniopsis smithogilvyi]|uniref:Uncharacterized protein n=1 Tax=Gnomoniopsis smithogilvyi TaxID=1191159 RepID=A0A9W8YYX3_9PEZI|nr:hypothetical protein N0V93_002498 [Gnomoniopsis smithogilvyi]